MDGEKVEINVDTGETVENNEPESVNTAVDDAVKVLEVAEQIAEKQTQSSEDVLVQLSVLEMLRGDIAELRSDISALATQNDLRHEEILRRIDDVRDVAEEVADEVDDTATPAEAVEEVADTVEAVAEAVEAVEEIKPKKRERRWL